MRKITLASKRTTLGILAVLATLCSLTVPAQAAKKAKDVSITITSHKSLVNMQSVDSTSLTEDGTKAAKLVMDYIDTKNPESAKTASAIYDKIIPKENYGGDYTALQWLTSVMQASDADRAKLLADPAHASYYEFFASNNFAQLKEYLNRKYKLTNLQDVDPGEGMKRRAFLEDFILFNNPRREEWEKTSKMMKAVAGDIKPGARIADIGSGPGYFSFKFSKAVGPKGKVFAIDTVQEHLDYVNGYAAKNGLGNIKTVLTTDHTIGMGDEQVDVAWMCSLYHIVYVTFKEYAKDEFIGAIHKALKKGGTFYVVDNGLVPDGVLPYHAPYIDKSLIIGQLQHYGFKYIKEYQFIPQRYILKFQKI